MTDKPETLISDGALLEMVCLALTTPPGPIVEVGVYKGGSAWYLARVATHRGCDLHLFDTFKGQPHTSKDDHHQIGDFADTSAGTVHLAIPDAILHVGVFPNTLPDDLQDISFVHCDVDQCQSIHDVITCLWPRVVPGGVMVFDDWDQDGGRKVIQAAFGDRVQDVNHRRFVRKETDAPTP